MNLFALWIVLAAGAGLIGFALGVGIPTLIDRFLSRRL